MLIVIAIVLFPFIVSADKAISDCRFPQDYRGSYYAKINNNDDFISKITIQENEMKPWGKCHFKIFDWFVLAEEKQNNSCSRCFQLILRSPLVIEVTTEEEYRCYSDEELFCQNVSDTALKRYFLYRQEILEEDFDTEYLCPFKGNFRMTYSANGGRKRCYSFISEFTNCPITNTFKIKYKDCSFPGKVESYQCLGDWDAFENQRYIILRKLDRINEFRFLCGIYHRNNNNENIYLALSSDDSCDKLYSSIIGEETMILHPVRISSQWTTDAKCTFPEWSFGQWEDLFINSYVINYGESEIVNFQTSICIHSENTSFPDRYVIYAKDKCGEEMYSCIWMIKRTMNILEFQLGKQVGNISQTSILCANEQFNQQYWLTKLRSDANETLLFPISGEYFGILPFQQDLCIRLATDCFQPYLLTEKIVRCQNINVALEVNQYLNYGNWMDGSIVYSYVFHLETKEFRCFAGKIEENLIKIVEIGENCVRQQIPLRKAMDLIKIGFCESYEMKSRNFTISFESTTISKNNVVLANSSSNVTGFVIWFFTFLQLFIDFTLILDLKIFMLK